MKKNVLIIASCLVALTMFPAITNAQFAKGDWLVEGGLGSINVSKTKNESQTSGDPDVYKTENNNFSISIFPRAGYFVSKNLAVGTTLGISYNSNKYKNFGIDDIKDFESKGSAVILDFTPFVRYYFPGKNIKTRFYGQVGAGISLDLSRKYDSKYVDNLGNTTTSYKYNYPKKYNGISAEALVGLNHFVSQNVAVNAALGYRYASSKETTSYTTNSPGGFSSTTDPTKYSDKTSAFIWNVGFTMLLHCKKKK